MVKQKILIDVDALVHLISCASDAHSLLADVHCYDNNIYENLGDALNATEYKVIEE